MATVDAVNTDVVQNAVFRYKLEPHIIEAITRFAKVHQHNDRHEYKDCWKDWCNENHTMLDVEAKRLEKLGFNGDAYDKFFKSGRYYFRNKKSTKVEPVERKKYVGLKRETLRVMDDFINTINKNDIKNDSKTSPAKAFIQFCDKHSEAIKEQVESLTNEENMTEKDINDKLKKTFKNRYFQKLKKSSN
jgi:hypothetical protein